MADAKTSQTQGGAHTVGTKPVSDLKPPTPVPLTEYPLTEYIVLVALAAGTEAPRNAYRVLKTVKARSQEAAVKAAADPSGEATYVAIPSRSFVPLKVTPKTTVQLELTEVKA